MIDSRGQKFSRSSSSEIYHPQFEKIRQIPNLFPYEKIWTDSNVLFSRYVRIQNGSFPAGFLLLQKVEGIPEGFRYFLWKYR